MKWLVIVLLSMLSFSAFATDIDVSDIRGGSEELVNFRKVDEGEMFSFILKHNQQEVFAKNLPAGAGLTSMEDGSWVFGWRPNDTQSGEYTLGFYAQDPNNFVYKSIRVVVANTKFMITAEEELSYLFTATDPDDDDVELAMTGLPTGATFTGSRFNPKLFSWTPTAEQVGVHTMMLTATDNPLSGTPKQDISDIEIRVTLLPKASMPFDFNRDGKVNGADFAMFSKHWLKGNPKVDVVEPVVITAEERLMATTVYKTATGTKYHKLDCSYLTGSATQSTIGECRDDGLESCSRCNPDDINYTSYSKKSLEEMLRDALGGVQ